MGIFVDYDNEKYWGTMYWLDEAEGFIERKV